MRDKRALAALIVFIAIVVFGGWLTNIFSHDPQTCPHAQVHRAFK